ncbi:MAG: DUF2207 domain-containing protein, partial [Gammaproteobacteria bacterium]|nr:DUF2207 domain-containing protein [Gammaproteobacteria bacterium]
MKLRVLSLLLFCVLLLPFSLQAREEILSYHSDIVVNDTGEMTVTENITVRAEGNRIKRGIYRDFPTNYRDRFGNRYRVGFDVEGVLRNGQIEAWHVKPLSNGVRVYFGSSDNYIDKGVHKYRFRYRTNRQLGFFDNHDELYWNVTGTDWAFPINKASAQVRLPDSIPADAITVEAYTGAQGSKGQDYHAEIRGNGLAYFETTRPLPQRHGLTIVTAFPKGHIREPTAEEKLQYLIDDNRQLLYLGLGLLLVLVYYWISWILVGRDPQSGVIITRYRPPEGYSPASMRFIERMGYDNTCFAVALVNLAVKGYLTISEVSSISGLSADKYSLKKTGKTNINMAPGESALVRKLFIGSSLVTLEQANHKRISDAKSAQETALKQNYEKIYFVTNTWYFLVGVLLTLLVLIAGFIAAPVAINDGSLFLLVWLTFWTFGVIALLKMAWLRWKMVKQNKIYILAALFYSAFALPFVAAEIAVLGQLVKLTSYTLVGIILATV